MPVKMLSFIDVIPAKTTVVRGESLNLLGGAANGGEPVEKDISVWGNDGNGWKALMTRRFLIEDGEHKHLYFTLGPEAFSDVFWGEEPEELELIIRDTEPGPDENGVLVFITDQAEAGSR